MRVQGLWQRRCFPPSELWLLLEEKAGRFNGELWGTSSVDGS